MRLQEPGLRTCRRSGLASPGVRAPAHPQLRSNRGGDLSLVNLALSPGRSRCPENFGAGLRVVGWRGSLPLCGAAGGSVRTACGGLLLPRHRYKLGLGVLWRKAQ